MAKARKAGIAVVVALLVVLLVGVLYVRSISTRALPNYSEDVALDGITDEVVVYRDAYAVPHIFARNEEDLSRAVGYCMAQDRLWQMDLLRRVCAGRLAEIFGKDLVEIDVLMRSLRFSEKSRMVLDRADENLVGSLEAFCDGVNQYIEAHGEKLPPEFSILGYVPEKWKPEHSLNLGGYMAWNLSHAQRIELVFHKILEKFGENKCRDLLSEVPAQRSVVIPDFAEKLTELDLCLNLIDRWCRLEDLGLAVFSGSNNWAVSGERSVTGKPILANDMHLELNAPGIWYQMHQVVDGKIDVTGVVLPGQPAVISGHNEHIAWGFTNMSVDDLDFYFERINPENSNEYEFNGKWLPMEVRNEKIKVKGGKIEEKEIRFTHRGPIIPQFQKVDGVAISMRWVGNEYSNEGRALFLLNRAKNWDEFKNAIRTFGSISQNIAYADTAGNIGIYCCAGIPIRKAGDGISIVPGWTDEYEWTGLVPFEDLPHSFNPEGGFVSSANNKTVDNDYPFYISEWFALPYRIDRIREMLTEKDKLSLEDFKRMHADQKSKFAEAIKDNIATELANSSGLTSLEKQALAIFASWDGVLRRTSPAASIFETFLDAFRRNTLSDELGEKLFEEFLTAFFLPMYAADNILRNGDSSWCDDVTTEETKETFADMVQESFKDAVAFLSDKLGRNPENWQWGRIHQLSLAHPVGRVKVFDMLFNFNRGPFGVGGSYHTVCPYGYVFTDPYKAVYGASHRQVYSLANWDESFSVIPTGISGIPASEHYCDQTKLYLDNDYHSDYTTRELVEKTAKYKMLIKGK